MLPRPGRGGRFKSRFRADRRVVAGVVLCMVIYALWTTRGSVEGLRQLPWLWERLKTPITWEVPEDGVHYLHFFGGEAAAGQQFVLLRLRLQAQAKIGYPVVPRCFTLVDDEEVLHYPLSRSPLFLERTDRFYLKAGDAVEGELLFQIPQERRAVRLLFARYQEGAREEKPQE